MSQDFAATKQQKARTTHTCDECFRDILPGETYSRAAGSWEGDFFTNVACAHCAVFRKSIDNFDDNYFESYYGGVPWWHENAYFSEGEIHGATFGQRLGLFRMSRHWQTRWRDRDGNLRPIPEVIERKKLAA